MPVTKKGRWYAGPEAADRAAVGPKIYGTTTTETAFDVEDALALIATVGAHSFLRTALTGSNNDLDIVAVTPGDQSAIHVVLADPSANNAALSVSVSSQTITVHLATNGSGTITSTATQVMNAINKSAAARALVVASLAPGNNGTGVVTALTSTALVNSSGTNPTADVTLEQSVDGSTDWHTVLTITQFTTATAAYKRATSDLAPGGSLRWKVTVGGTATPLLAVSAQATASRSSM